MSSRLTVIFYIILCLEIGIVLTVLPWVPHGWFGLSDWGNNYFLLIASRKVGFGVQRLIASGWIRGAVSGIGSAPRALDEGRPYVESSRQNSSSVTDATQPVKTDPLSDYPRRNH